MRANVLFFLLPCSVALACGHTQPPAANCAPGAVAAAPPTASSTAANLPPQATGAPPDDAFPYQLPADDLVRLADAPFPPRPLPGPDDDALLVLQVPPLVPVSELAQPELKLAGVRFNPDNDAPTRSTYFTGLTFVEIGTGASHPVAGTPADGRIRNPAWSPNGAHVAFTVALSDHVELWVADRASGAAHRLGSRSLNAAHPSRPCNWTSDSLALVCRVVPDGRVALPEPSRVPRGPRVEETSGKKAAAPTFEDLLHDEHDAALFEHHFTSEVWLVGLDGHETRLGGPALVVGARSSPDASSLLVETLHRPFSYHVPWDRFPTRTEVWDKTGKQVALVADVPLATDVPVDFDGVRTGRRDVDWRADAPATLTWVEARDGGDPKAQVPVRDELFQLPAPFTGAPVKLASLSMRFSEALWSSGSLAIVREAYWKTRQQREWRIAPDQPNSQPQKLVERSSEDRYQDPGEYVMRQTPRGKWVLWTNAAGTQVMRAGDGASPTGDHPFVDAFDLSTRKTARRWQSTPGAYEYVVSVSADGQHALTRRESKTDPPNLYARDLASGATRALTSFADPYPALKGTAHEIIQYKRDDGLTLSGTLYTPPGWDGKTRLPLLMWAYPREFKTKAAAGQVQDSPDRFPLLAWWSPLFFLAHGYAVLDDPAFPIVGEGTEQPNDTYVKQLVADANAAVEAVVSRGVADRSRIAIGGHSYGAFTTANLLAHTRLFRAGIARSGAYNRTLTPFSFQSEERTFWEARSTYIEMSPFTHADTIDDPLLLVHGMEDDNQGTYPIQSERLFAALDGLGKTARLVMLPHEAHGYRARESVLHMLWEMDHWLDRYVKNAAPR
jgi:dipeptidyl aminopeptidase/acylaminoacyl peptidase